MGITEIFRKIWLFSANKERSSESFIKQPTQLIVELNSSLQHIIVTLLLLHYYADASVFRNVIMHLLHSLQENTKQTLICIVQYQKLD